MQFCDKTLCDDGTFIAGVGGWEVVKGEFAHLFYWSVKNTIYGQATSTSYIWNKVMSSTTHKHIDTYISLG